MSLTSAFFDAELVGGVYDRVYSAERFAEYFAAFIANGVFPDPATNLQVVANVPRDMTVLVKSGLGWINGYYCNNDGNYPLTISPASGTLPRVDAVVLRWSRSNRSISLEVKTGVATSSPSAPSLERSADNYELMLASIEVVAGATSIAQANITDKRPDSSVCGWVKGVVDQVDTTNLFAQYDAAFQEWFDNIKSQLSGNIATNLQNQIDRNAANIAVINATTLKEDTKTALGLPISAGPDDAFKVLAHVGNLHVWKRITTLSEATYKPVVGVGNHSVQLNSGDKLYYSDSVDIASLQDINLASPVSTFSFDGYSVPSVVGKYIRKNDGPTIYIYPASDQSISGSTLWLRKCHEISAAVDTPAGTHTDFVTSTDSTAYPRDGDVGDCHYTYLGQLGGGARIEVGSYVGTETYGTNVKITLEANFTPKLFVLAAYIATSGNTRLLFNQSDGYSMQTVVLDSLSSTTWSNAAGQSSIYIKRSDSGKGVIINPRDKNGFGYVNRSGNTYYYAFIG